MLLGSQTSPLLKQADLPERAGDRRGDSLRFLRRGFVGEGLGVAFLVSGDLQHGA